MAFLPGSRESIYQGEVLWREEREIVIMTNEKIVPLHLCDGSHVVPVNDWVWTLNRLGATSGFYVRECELCKLIFSDTFRAMYKLFKWSNENSV